MLRTNQLGNQFSERERERERERDKDRETKTDRDRESIIGDTCYTYTGNVGDRYIHLLDEIN